MFHLDLIYREKIVFLFSLYLFDSSPLSPDHRTHLWLKNKLWVIWTFTPLVYRPTERQVKLLCAHAQCLV